jgi:hypothetical protein
MGLFGNLFSKKLRQVRVTDAGFRIRSHQGWGRWEERGIGWDEVASIEAARVPTAVVENTFLIFWPIAGDRIDVGDWEEGFHELLADVLRRYPETAPAWMRLYSGPPNVADAVVLWSRDDAGASA